MRNGWIMLLVLTCAAFLVSCGKKNDTSAERGELVQAEVWEKFPWAFAFFYGIHEKYGINLGNMVYLTLSENSFS